MATGLTSSSFMTAPGAWTSTLVNKLDKVDCSQVLAAVLVADKQLLGHIKMGEVGTNIEVNWIEDSLNAASIVASSSASNVVTITSPAWSLAKKAGVRIGTLLQPAGKEYLLQVTASVTKATVTVATYGNTSAAWAALTATKMYLVGNPYSDIEDASSDISQKRTKKRNFMQIFERAIEIGQTRKNMSMEAVVNELQHQIKLRTLEIKRELDMAIINSYAKYSSGYTGDTERRTMAGLIQYIKDYDLSGTANSDQGLIQVSGALTEAYINSLCYKMWDLGGFDESSDPIIVVGAKQARVFSAMEKYLRRVEQGERTVGYYRNVFLSDMGVELPIVLDRWVPEDKLLILDRSRLAIRPMAGDNWHLEKMAKTGRTDKWQLSGQFTLEVRNPKQCHGLLYDLS